MLEERIRAVEQEKSELVFGLEVFATKRDQFVHATKQN